MADIQSLFADYASYHQTRGNKLFHRLGIPMIMLSLIGMLARVQLYNDGIVIIDAAMVLVTVAQVVYFILDKRLGAIMLGVSAVFYFAGLALPMTVNVTLFVLGWIFQFIGHSVYEHRAPAFMKNGMHLLVGPLWILNDLVPLVRSTPASPTTT